MSYAYKSDDYFYDIEIRNNFFVTSQYYPKQKKFIISYLERIGKSSTNHAMYLTKYNASANYTSNLYLPDNSALKKVVSYIRDANPALTRAGISYEFEDLHNPYNIIKFAKRMGLADSYTVFNGRKHDSSGKLLIRDEPNRYYTNNSKFVNAPDSWTVLQNSFGIGDDIPINGYLYPIKRTDLDYKPSKEGQGFRFGYNSTNYDMTMLAFLLGNISKVFFNAYIADMKAEFAKKKKNKTSHEQYLINNQHKIRQKWTELYNKQIIGSADEYEPNDCFTPELLVKFNALLFEDEANKKYMPNALRKIGANRYPKYRFQDIHMSSSEIQNIYNGWKYSNRYIDVMKLNNRPNPLSLKRAAGMLGLQIKESESNTRPEDDLTSLKNVADTIAYNISDVYATKYVFEQDYPFQSTFDLNQKLLKRYDYLTYEQAPEAKDPNASEKLKAIKGEDHLRRKILKLDDTGTTFITNVIAPYPNTAIKDKPVVDYMYPDTKVLERLKKEGKAKPNAKPFDVLEDTYQWACKNIPNGREKFKPIYDYYSQFRGKNVNNDLNDLFPDYDPSTNSFNAQQTLRFQNYFGANKKPYYTFKRYDPDTDSFITTSQLYVKKFKPSEDLPNNKKSVALPYYNAKGEPSGSIVNMSYGGVHGAETQYNKFKQDYHRYQAKIAALNQLKIQYGAIITQDDNDPTKVVFEENSEYNATIQIYAHKDEVTTITDNLGHKFEFKIISYFVKSKSTQTHPVFKKLEPPKLFKTDSKGKLKINEQYQYVSIGIANHEDFSSYYPLLIYMLAIFRNSDGQDIYGELYLERLKMKARSKDDLLSEAIREAAEDAQQTAKKLLNSGSGGGDANFESTIKCNNAILSMRIIGQLFAWRIGEAASLAGGRVPSTNTDGLYVMGLSKEINQKIVDQNAAHAMLAVKPEIVDKFISKDSNNRIEWTDDKMGEAKGGQLTAWDLANLTKNIDHPAICDYTLSHYLVDKEDPCNQKFDRKFAFNIMTNYLNSLANSPEGMIKALRYLQWIAVSSTGKHRFLYKVENDTQTVSPLPHTNRFFLIRNDSKLAKETHNTSLKLAQLRVIDAKNTQRRIKKLPNSNHVLAMQIQRNDNEAMIIMNQKLSSNYLYQIQQAPINPNTGKDFNGNSIKEIRSTKVKGLSDTQNVYLNLQGLEEYNYQPELLKKLINSLDYDAYIDYMEHAFELSWLNK